MAKDILEKIDGWRSAADPDEAKWDPWFREGYKGAQGYPQQVAFCHQILTEASTEIQQLRVMKESYGRLYKMVYGISL